MALASAILVFAVILAGRARDSSADDSHVSSAAVLVPALVKAAEYDRHFRARANGHVRTIVIFRNGDAASEKAAHDVVALLANTAKIAGLSHEERAEPFIGANALASEIRSGQSALLILAPGLAGDAPAIAHELDGIDVLSAALDPNDVANGVVFGVDVGAGKATLVVRLAQARRQNVAFEASLLKLARIE